MNVCIAGGRDFNDYSLLEEVMTEFCQLYGSDFTILSGGARGADQLGEKWANHNGIRIRKFIPDWSIGKAAGMIRNEEMSTYADVLIAFWDSKSKGTKHMINTCKRKGIKTKTVFYSI